jgi:hypothetical protein
MMYDTFEGVKSVESHLRLEANLIKAKTSINIGVYLYTDLTRQSRAKQEVEHEQ